MQLRIIGILIIAALLRVTALSSHMPALYGDEISIAYNAYSVIKTGSDEFGKFLPIQFESWGDQKNPVYIYLTAFFQLFFGLNEWSVRLPSALAGVVAVYATYLLVKQIFTVQSSLNNKLVEQTAQLSALLLALNPWHIHISRGGYEANLALTLGLFGAYFLIKQIKSPSRKYLLLSLSSNAVALYTYYTTKMFIPLLVLAILIWGYFAIRRGDFKKYLQDSLKYCLFLTLSAIPVIYLALFVQGQARFQSINIFANPTIENRVVTARITFTDNPLLIKVLENKYTYYLHDFLEYYFDNFSGQFLFVAGDSSLRYAIRDHGMFYLIEAPFLIIGFVLLYKSNRKAWALLTLWMLLAPLPTALVGKAYGLRSIAILPIPLIFTAFGILMVRSFIALTRPRQLFTAVLASLYVLSVSNWFARYIFEYPTYGRYWYDSMQKELIEYAKSQEANYDNIIVTRYYGKTEMYYAFYAKIDPKEYQAKSNQRVTIAGTPMVQFGKYYFGDLADTAKDFNQLGIPPKTLVIASPKFPYGDDAIKAADDSRTLFKVVKP